MKYLLQKLLKIQLLLAEIFVSQHSLKIQFIFIEGNSKFLFIYYSMINNLKLNGHLIFNANFYQCMANFNQYF